MDKFQNLYLLEQAQGLQADINRSKFPKKYINLVKNCFLRDGYTLALHKRANIPYNEDNTPLVHGFPNNGGTSLINTLFMSSSALATINYSIPNSKDGFPDVLLVLIPQACLDKNNPEGLLIPTDSQNYCEDATHFIDPSYVLGYFSQDEKGKYSFTSNIPKDNNLGIKRREFLNPNGLYSDTHTYPNRVPADMDDRDLFGNMHKKDDTLIGKHPMLARLALRFSRPKAARLPEPSNTSARPVASVDMREKYGVASLEVPPKLSGKGQKSEISDDLGR